MHHSLHVGGGGAGGSDRGARSIDQLRADVRELAHDVRNALNGAAVNIEAAKVFVQRPGLDPHELEPFLARAAEQIDVAATISKATIKLVNDVLDAAASNRERPQSKDS